MNDKVKASVLFVLSTIVGALVVGWAVNRDNIQELQAAQIQQFINAGPLFTAQQGQQLCEEVRALAEESYGYRASGKPLPVCDYLERK